MDSSSLFRDRIIHDAVQIELLDRESGLDFFIPVDEIGKLDWELINDERYEKSRNEIGELDKIYVSVNPSDPYKSESSQFRTHLRVLDGRHKYQTGKRLNKPWKHVYVRVNDFMEFELFRTHFGTGKSQQKQASETKMIIDQMCSYYFDVKAIPRNRIAATVVKSLENTRFSKTTIYRHMDRRFLTNTGRPRSEKKLSKKDLEIIKLNNEIDSLNRQLFSVKEERDSLARQLSDLRINSEIR